MSYYYSNNSQGGGFLSGMPRVTKNILIINIILFAATWLGERVLHSDLMSSFVLYDPASHYFKIWQPITYMFMHGGFWHILFNMYTLFVFGGVVERMIGEKKFLLFYILSGLGAAALHIAISRLFIGVSSPMVGASGAIYGLLIAYAMLFPDSHLTLLFPPVTLSAKWMVIIFAGIELFTGITGTAEGIAHFAHLGGMIVGFILIWYWRKTGKLFERENFK